MNRVLLTLLTVGIWFGLYSYTVAEDKFEWVPSEAKDNSGGGGFSYSTPVLPVIETVTPKKTADVTKFSKRYVIELERFGISNSGKDAAKTSAGINAALKYAAGAGFNYIQFPKGTYLIDHTDPIVLTLKNTIVDLNGAVLQMQTNDARKCKIMSITYGAENLRLTNGTLKGDYTARGSAHEGVGTLRFESGTELEVDHMRFTDSAGFCVTSRKGMDRVRDFGYHGVKAESLESGGFSKDGKPIAIADKCRTSHPYDMSDFSGEFEFGYIFGYGSYVSIFDRNYRALFYDSEMGFLEARDLLQYKKYKMPENTKFMHLQFNQATAKDQATSMVGSLTNMRGPVDVHFHHNRMDNNASLGFAFCGGQRWVIEDCLFQKNGGGTPPHYGIDFEDGWDLMQDVVMRNNRFKDNHTGDVVVCAGSEMLFEGNEFEKTVHVWGRTHNYTFRKNRFLGGNAGFMTRTGVATVEKNIFKGGRVSVKYDDKGFNDGLNHAPGEAVSTPAVTLRDNVLEDIPMFKGTYFNLSGGMLKNVKFQAGKETRMVELKGCEIVDSSIVFEANGPDVTYSVENCKGDLKVTGPGIARKK